MSDNKTALRDSAEVDASEAVEQLREGILDGRGYIVVLQKDGMPSSLYSNCGVQGIIDVLLTVVESLQDSINDRQPN